MKVYLAADCVISLNRIFSTHLSSKENAVDHLPDGVPPFVLKPIPWQNYVPSKENKLADETALERLFFDTADVLFSQYKCESQKLTDRFGLIISTTKGNIDLLDGDKPIDARCYLSVMAERIATYYGFISKPIVISNACISGISALVVGKRLIQSGQYDEVMVLGGDLMTEFVHEGFAAFHALSSTLCMPFDAARDGLTLGEACGGVILTRYRERISGRNIVLEGGAMTSDASHVTAPSRTGDGLYYAIQATLSDVGIPAEAAADNIDYVNAHGTGTVYNDEMESKAIDWAGLQTCPVNSLKPYLGHTLGASGIVEAILCMEQMHCDRVWRTPGFSSLGVPKAICVSAHEQKTVRGNVNKVLKLASGFGGTNGALILVKEGFASESKSQTVSGKPVETASYRISSEQIPKGTKPDFYQRISDEFHRLNRPNLRFFKMDSLSKLGYVTSEYLLSNVQLAGKYQPQEVGIVLANRSSSLDTDLAHQRIVEQHLPEGASPSVFVYTLPSVTAGEISIRHKIKGECTFFIQSEKDLNFLRSYAELLMTNGILKAVIYGWCELLGEEYDADFHLLELSNDLK
jgi:3-oxoacyl-(acyl-carrier-protein) synthase